MQRGATPHPPAVSTHVIAPPRPDIDRIGKTNRDTASPTQRRKRSSRANDRQAKGKEDATIPRLHPATTTDLQSGSLRAGNRLCLGLSGVFPSLTTSLRRAHARERRRNGEDRITGAARPSPTAARRSPSAPPRPARVPGPPRAAGAIPPARPPLRARPPARRGRAPPSVRPSIRPRPPVTSGAARATQPPPPAARSEAASSPPTDRLPPRSPMPSPRAPNRRRFTPLSVGCGLSSPVGARESPCEVYHVDFC